MHLSSLPCPSRGPSGAAGSRIAEIDLNPLKVLPEGRGCIVVDALIVPAQHPAQNNGDET